MKNSLTSLAPHCHRVDLGYATIWFSYAVPVGVSDGRHTYTRQNSWGTTTGKHINLIDNGNRAARLDDNAFERTLETILNSRPSMLV